MPRKLKRSLPPNTFNIWTSFTDLMSNAFMVLTLLLLLTMSKIPSFNRHKRLQQPDDKQQKIIVLPAEEYKFTSGSAELPINLRTDIQKNPHDGKILKAIKQQLDRAQKKIDIIEVIGHTDGQQVGYLKCHGKVRGRSNLDQKLEVVATRNKNVSILCPGSNTDLGLMRALAVIKELQKAQNREKEGRFKQVTFRAYSAGQLLLPKNRGFAKSERKENKQRRRIEIRFTQLAQETTPQ
ncbi:MAG: flagellar motor protein [Calothrix sp. MO_192.B10]|nr:flagellar motor protein [Calothrix sp. MO_192.B10]